MTRNEQAAWRWKAAGLIALARRRDAARQYRDAMTGHDNAIAVRGAVNAAIKALLRLGKRDRARVLRTVAVFCGLKPPPAPPTE